MGICTETVTSWLWKDSGMVSSFTCCRQIICAFVQPGFFRKMERKWWTIRREFARIGRILKMREQSRNAGESQYDGRDTADHIGGLTT